MGKINLQLYQSAVKKVSGEHGEKLFKKEKEVMRNSLEDQDFGKLNAWCFTAAPQVCSQFRPAVSIIVHKQSDQLTNLTCGEASAHRQAAPLSSAKVNAASKRRHVRTLGEGVGEGVGVAEGGGVFTGHCVCKLERLSPILFFP